MTRLADVACYTHRVRPAPTALLLCAACALLFVACDGAEQRASDAGASAADSGPGGDDDAGIHTDAGAVADAGPDDAGPETPAPITLGDHRDRLLDSYAAVHALADRCAAWSAFDDVQRGVFLTITDQLGKRSFLTLGPADPDEPRTGDDLDMALAHVTTLYAVNGKKPGTFGGCGGGEFNRMFYSADDALLSRLRSVGTGLPAWRDTEDLAGPHEPFDQSNETEEGAPRGQVHFFTAAAAAAPPVLERNGVEGVVDGNIVEHDIDYNLLHDSCPECSYLGGTRAR